MLSSPAAGKLVTRVYAPPTTAPTPFRDLAVGKTLALDAIHLRAYLHDRLIRQITQH